MPEKKTDSLKCHDFKIGDTILVDTSKIKDFDPRNLEANRYDWKYSRFCKEVKTEDVDDEGFTIWETKPILYTFLCEHSPQEGHGVIAEIAISNSDNSEVITMVHLDMFRKATLEEC